MDVQMEAVDGAARGPRLAARFVASFADCEYFHNFLAGIHEETSTDKVPKRRPSEMRFYGMVLIAGAAVLGACSGGDKSGTTADTAATGSTTAAATPATGAAPAGTATAAPITGTTIDVKMIGDEKGYRFEPSTINAKPGDGIKFTMVSGGPHNVAFDPATIPAAARAQLDANFGADRMSELSSNLKMNPNDTFTLSLGNLPAGAYPFHCTPHLAMGMKGTINIQ